MTMRSHSRNSRFVLWSASVAIATCLLTPTIGLADDAPTWTPTGGPSAADVKSIAGEEDLVFVVTESSALFVSIDGGGNFAPATEAPGAPLSVMKVLGETAFAVAGAPPEVVVSIDAGNSWIPATVPLTDVPSSLSLIPRGEDLLVQALLAAGAGAELWKSSDFGSSWTQIALPDQPIGSVVPVGEFLIAMGANQAIHRTSNDGRTWQVISSSLPFDAYSLLSTQSVVIARGFFSNSMFRSTNAGQSWSSTAVTGVPTSQIKGMIAMGESLVAHTTSSVHRSLDGGVTWTVVGASDLPTTVASLWGAEPALFVVDAAGHLHRSLDMGETWTLGTQGLAASEIGAVAVRPDGTLLAASKWSSTAYWSLDQGANWQLIEGADFVGDIRAFYSQAAVVHAATDGGGILRSEDNGATWTPLNSGLPLLNPFDGIYEPLTSVASVDDALFVGTGGGFIFISDGSHCSCSGTTSGAGVYRSLDGGDSWQQVSSGLPINTFDGPKVIYRPIVALTSVGGTLFAATRQHGVYRSTNLGASWQPTSGITANVYDFEIVGPDVFVVGEPGQGGSPLHVALDGGSAWTPVGGASPSPHGFSSLTSHNGDLFASGSTDTGTVHGVHRSVDGGLTWVLDDPSLGEVSVEEVAAAADVMIGGTLGHGVWLRQPAPTTGDLNGDGVVDGADLGILLGNWGTCANCDNCVSDLTGDCNVDGADLGILLANWG